MSWMVIYGYEVQGGALNISSTELPRPWSPRESSPSRKNPHGRTGNWTRDLMTSSQKIWPLDHEAGHFRIFLGSSNPPHPTGYAYGIALPHQLLDPLYQEQTPDNIFNNIYSFTQNNFLNGLHPYISHNVKILLLLSWPWSLWITFTDKRDNTAKNLLQEVCYYISVRFLFLYIQSTLICTLLLITVVHTCTVW
jgi:hypothetical protein